MTKILFCAPNINLSGEWCWSFNKELKKFGSVSAFDYRLWPQPNVKLEKIANLIKPDLLFIIKGERLKPSTIKLVKKMGAKAINFNCDDFQGYDEDLIKEFDHVFTPSEDFIPQYEKLGVKASWLNYVYDPDIHHPLNLPKRYDVTFVGTYYQERGWLFKQAKLLGSKIQLYGNGWENIGIQTPRINAERMVELYSESKIILNIHQRIMAEHKTKANLRTYETLGCGAFLLTDYCLGMEELFKDGEHLVIYKDAFDLNEKIEYYLKNQEEREKIAKQGHERVKEFTIEKTLEKIFKEIRL